MSDKKGFIVHEKILKILQILDYYISDKSD